MEPTRGTKISPFSRDVNGEAKECCPTSTRLVDVDADVVLSTRINSLDHPLESPFIFFCHLHSRQRGQSEPLRLLPKAQPQQHCWGCLQGTPPHPIK